MLGDNLEEVSTGMNPSGSLAVTPDGAIVGWMTTEGRPHVVERGGSQEWDLPVVDEAGSLAALISDGDTCKEGDDGSGCVAFVNSVDGTSARSAISHGIVDTVPGVLAVWAILRLDVTDGSVELAAAPVPDPGGQSPFVLPVR